MTTKPTITDEEIIELLTSGTSPSQIRKKYTAGRYRVERLRVEAVRRGHSPEHDMVHTVPDGYHVKGTSTLYKDGKPALQWVKSSINHERQAELMRHAVEAMALDLPKISSSPVTRRTDADLMAVYPIADPHIGMMSWGDETGEDWDIKIAEKKLLAVFDRLVKTAPNCETATIINLGDLFHAENMEGVTSRSGHNLDMDSRYAKMVSVGVNVIRQMIKSALEHHKHVNVINTPGNHDETAALFLSVALSHIYENEPRATIDTTPSVFQYVRWGASLLGVHHGHTAKADKLMGVMASDRAKDWGETRHRYWLTGHIHHDSRKEYAGCTVESFRTLIARDAYAHAGGYRSQRDAKCLVIHKEHGEIERHTVNVEMV